MVSTQKRAGTKTKLKRLVENIRAKKALIKAADDEWRVDQATVIELLDDVLEQESVRYESDLGERVTVTRVQTTSTTIDPDQLKKAIGAKAFNKLTTPHLDMAKLEDAIAEGTVDPITVATCSSTRENRPYIKVTAKAPAKS